MQPGAADAERDAPPRTISACCGSGSASRPAYPRTIPARPRRRRSTLMRRVHALRPGVSFGRSAPGRLEAQPSIVLIASLSGVATVFLHASRWRSGAHAAGGKSRRRLVFEYWLATSPLCRFFGSRSSIVSPSMPGTLDATIAGRSLPPVPTSCCSASSGQGCERAERRRGARPIPTITPCRLSSGNRAALAAGGEGRSSLAAGIPRERSAFLIPS